MNSRKKNNIEIILESFDEVKKTRHNIFGIHLWGREERHPHYGDLSSLYKDTSDKKLFLKMLTDTFDDEKKRYFVPEVNGKKEDIISIVNDLIVAGCIFL